MPRVRAQMRGRSLFGVRLEERGFVLVLWGCGGWLEILGAGVEEEDGCVTD